MSELKLDPALVYLSIQKIIEKVGDQIKIRPEGQEVTRADLEDSTGLAETEKSLILAIRYFKEMKPQYGVEILEQINGIIEDDH